MEIGQKLRIRRVELGLSRSELAKRIHVTPSAIANYENGVSYPKPDILISLIIELQVDANYLYQDYLSNSKIRSTFGHELTQKEEEAIIKYRALTENGKRLVHMIIDEEYERKQSEEWVEYRCIQPGVRKLHSGFMIGNYNDKVRFKKKYEIKGMEYCYQIHVDKFEPVFKKYSILALRYIPAEHNQIGIFRVDDVYYLRILQKKEDACILRSLNANEPDIEIKKEDRLECIGTVLGQIYGPNEMVPENIDFH